MRIMKNTIAQPVKQRTATVAPNVLVADVNAAEAMVENVTTKPTRFNQTIQVAQDGTVTLSDSQEGLMLGIVGEQNVTILQVNFVGKPETVEERQKWTNIYSEEIIITHKIKGSITENESSYSLSLTEQGMTFIPAEVLKESGWYNLVYVIKERKHSENIQDNVDTQYELFASESFIGFVFDNILLKNSFPASATITADINGNSLIKNELTFSFDTENDLALKVSGNPATLLGHREDKYVTPIYITNIAKGVMPLFNTPTYRVMFKQDKNEIYYEAKNLGDRHFLWVPPEVTDKTDISGFWNGDWQVCIVVTEQVGNITKTFISCTKDNPIIMNVVNNDLKLDWPTFLSSEGYTLRSQDNLLLVSNEEPSINAKPFKLNYEGEQINALLQKTDETEVVNLDMTPVTAQKKKAASVESVNQALEQKADTKYVDNSIRTAIDDTWNKPC